MTTDDAEVRELIGNWRAASNVMSQADGEGPCRDVLRQCAKELEKALAEHATPAVPFDAEALRMILQELALKCFELGSEYEEPEEQLESYINTAFVELLPHLRSTP